MDHTGCLLRVHRPKRPTSLPAAPPGLPEGFLLEKNGIASLWVADGVLLVQLGSGGWLLSLLLPQPLALASRGQTNSQQPQDTQESHAAAAAVATVTTVQLLHPPQRHVVNAWLPSNRPLNLLLPKKSVPDSGFISTYSLNKLETGSLNNKK